MGLVYSSALYVFTLGPLLNSVSEIHTATIGCHVQMEVLYRKADDGLWG